MSKADSNSIYRIKVSLRHVEPPVWRRIEVPADVRLDELHEVLQVVMGWTDSHLHSFRVGRVAYGMPDPYGDDDMADERNVQLYRIAAEGDKFSYEYDFGDGWEHELKVEKVVAPEPGVSYPRCIDGRRACPPEDCGGAWGYQNLLEILADPDHEEYEERREWMGGSFDPEAFDPDAINAELSTGGGPGFDADDDDLFAGMGADANGEIADFTTAHAARLTAFLAAPARPSGTMRYEELAGFLFAVACSPELIRPSDWLPMIFNDQDANYATLEEAQDVLGAVMALYNWNVQGVLDQTVALPPGVDMRAPAAANFEAAAPLSLWARGFAAGHGWLEELWDEYVPESFDEELGACMLALSFFASRELAEAYRGESKREGPTIEETAETIREMFPGAMQSYAHMAWSIQTVLREQDAPPEPARSRKVGRNEPCPCGSGKKYKKCCGLNVH